MTCLAEKLAYPFALARIREVGLTLIAIKANRAAAMALASQATEICRSCR
jgi:hypothetical protein